MAGIGEASAILGVAQLGLQLAQTLVTVIGDYRDAATNINRLRDEIHLTSISLQQLGDLAKQNSLLPGRGVLEATNLRERCRAVIWEIRTVIKKGDDPLHPNEISKREIDVGYFTAWKWALWTKKHLDGPRLELDRLKDSLTLTFVTHMAIVGSRRDRDLYKQQIPGIKRNVDWAEERYRGNDEEPLESPVPAEILNAGPAMWQQFIDWKATQLVSPDESADDLSHEDGFEITSTETPTMPNWPDTPAPTASRYDCWALDPMTGAARLPLIGPTVSQNRDQLIKTWIRLDPWYATQTDALLRTLKNEPTYEWFVMGFKIVHRSLFRRLERPPTLQVYLRGDVRALSPVTQTSRLQTPAQTKTGAPEVVESTLYSAVSPIDMPISDDEQGPSLSDEEIIEKQLALYQQ